MDIAVPVIGLDGQYTSNLQVTQEGDYSVLITMENANTAGNPDISTICSMNNLRLDITDITTVPSQSTVVSSPVGAEIMSGSTGTYVIQSRDADMNPQAVTSDSYTLTLTCQVGTLCGDEVYSFMSTPSATTDGQYDVLVSPTLGGFYDVSITMENTSTVADQNIDTNVSGITLTLEVIDSVTVPVACEVTVAPTTGDIVRPDGEAFAFTVQTKSADGRNQPVTDDVFTVTLTSITTEE